MRYAIVVNAIFLVICVTISLLLKDPTATSESKEIIEILYFSVNALLDAIMVVGLSYFGYRFGRKQSAKSTVATRILPRSPMMFLYVNWVLAAMSLLRGIFNIILITLITREDRLEMIYFNSDGDRKMTPYYLVLFFIAAEVLPTICVIVTLWKRPSKSRSAKKKELRPTSTEADRAAAYSIDDRSGIVVRHFGDVPKDTEADAASPSQAPPPAWWSSFVTASMVEGGSLFSSDGPPPSEGSSDGTDDEYMMFRGGGIVNTGSATGNQIQISEMTRNQILVNAPLSGSLLTDSYTSPQSSYLQQPSYLQHSSLPGGPISSTAPQQPTSTSTPPSFDTWMKPPPGQTTPPHQEGGVSPYSSAGSSGETGVGIGPGPGAGVQAASFTSQTTSTSPGVAAGASYTSQATTDSSIGSYAGYAHSDHSYQPGTGNMSVTSGGSRSGSSHQRPSGGSDYMPEGNPMASYSPQVYL
jgi:hypothetical protein